MRVWRHLLSIALAPTATGVFLDFREQGDMAPILDQVIRCASKSNYKANAEKAKKNQITLSAG